MIDNKDIWQVARLMIRTHGDHADMVAAQHVDERLAQAVDRSRYLAADRLGNRGTQAG